MTDSRDDHESDTHRPAGEMQPAPHDPGFRRMVIWILLAFLFAAVVSLAAVTLVIHYFG